jgi:hypothetical protein
MGSFLLTIICIRLRRSGYRIIGMAKIVIILNCLLNTQCTVASNVDDQYDNTIL